MELAGGDQHPQILEQIRWITRLRWVAGACIALAVFLAYVIEPYPLGAVSWIAALVATYSGLLEVLPRLYRWRGGPRFGPGVLKMVLYALAGLDLLVLAAIIHLTGGVESILVPVYLLYLPPVASVLSRRATYIYASFAWALLGTVFGLQYAGLLPHSHPQLGVESGLYREGSYVVTSLIFQACFLYVGAYIAGHIASRLRQRNQELAELYEATQRLAVTDGLTGLYNTRYFYRALEDELARSRRYQHPVSLIMFDLDDFKKYNDRYGHLAGDDLLQELAGLVTDVTRQTDVVARYGGEEFSVILPETVATDAAKLAERLRAAVECHAFRVPHNRTAGRITISVGVAAYPDDASSVKDLVNCADMALLHAKAHKNRICLFSDVMTNERSG